MTNTVDETTRGQGGYLPGRAGNEGSAPSMDQGTGTDGQAAAQPVIGQAETGAVETAAGAGSQEAPDRAGSGQRQESKIVRELKDQRKKKREAQAAAAYWKGVADGRMGAPTVAPHAPAYASPDPTAFESLDDYEDALSGYPDDEAEGGPAGSTLLDRDDFAVRVRMVGGSGLGLRLSLILLLLLRGRGRHILLTGGLKDGEGQCGQRQSTGKTNGKACQAVSP